jgi:hypothetical protein
MTYSEAIAWTRGARGRKVRRPEWRAGAHVYSDPMGAWLHRPGVVPDVDPAKLWRTELAADDWEIVQ